MSKLDPKLAEDKALRDSARLLVQSDIALLKGDVGARSVGKRLKDRMTEGSVELVETTVDFAGRNRWKIAGVAAGIGVFLARGPIFRFFSHLFRSDETSEDGQSEEQADSTEHCDDRT